MTAAAGPLGRLAGKVMKSWKIAEKLMKSRRVEDAVHRGKDIEEAVCGVGTGIPTRPNASDPRLQGAFRELWREKDRIPGGTAGALRSELPRGDTKHVRKAQERISQLRKLLKDPSLSPSDRRIAQDVIDDLVDALNTPRGL